MKIPEGLFPNKGEPMRVLPHPLVMPASLVEGYKKYMTNDMKIPIFCDEKAVEETSHLNYNGT